MVKLGHNNIENNIIKDINNNIFNTISIFPMQFIQSIYEY